MMLLMVLISDTPCAPPRRAASPCGTMLPTFGVSFTKTGTVLYLTAQPVIRSFTAGSWPTALPMPRSHIPCGQPKFSSSPSAPASMDFLMISRHSTSVSTMRETMIGFFGNSFLVSVISRKFVSRGRSVMSSMFVKPAACTPRMVCPAKRLETF